MQEDNWVVDEKDASKESLKTLHKCIIKVSDDIERLSFNTAVSAFMIAVNELSDQKCHSRSVLEPLLIILAPFAPFITEELWQKLGHDESIHKAQWPKGDESLLVENSFKYPVSINGKVRTTAEYPLDMSKDDLEKSVLALDVVMKWTEGKTPKKVIIVPGRIINIVI